jgi:molybdopterin molybdotransferase
VRLGPDAEGRLAAHKHPREGAGIITTLTETDGLVVLPEDWTRIEPGTEVDFIPYSALI